MKHNRSPAVVLVQVLKFGKRPKSLAINVSAANFEASEALFHWHYRTSVLKQLKSEIIPMKES